MAYNSLIKYSDSAVKRYPLKADEIVYQGDAITLLRSTGIAQVCAGTAGETFLGFATEGVDAAAWARAGSTSGNISIQVANGGQRATGMAITGSGSTGIIAAADVGKTVFATAAQTFTVLGGNVPVGTLVPSASGATIITTGGYGAYSGAVTSHYGAIQLWEPGFSPNGQFFDIPIISMLAANIADGDIVTAYPLGAAVGGSFMITGFYSITTATLTTTGDSTILNIEIGSTNLTGGALTISEAAHATLGSVATATAITGANFGTASDTISIEAASTAAFTGGSVTLHIVGYKTGV